MFLNDYRVESDGTVRISAAQASRFAKEVAGDFNPIHDPDAKRFCVPGDLLFCLVLSKYGISQRMSFTFTGMVGDNVGLRFPEAPGASIEVTDDAGKTYLRVERSGDVSTDPQLVERLARNYVAFSGQNFPYILAPLMARHKVMINIERPLVIYESMSFDLSRLDLTDPRLDLTDATLDVAGKRGDAFLHFRFSAGGETVGTGLKKLVLSGLREYDQAELQRFIDLYNSRKPVELRAAAS